MSPARPTASATAKTAALRNDLKPCMMTLAPSLIRDRGEPGRGQGAWWYDTRARAELQPSGTHLHTSSRLYGSLSGAGCVMVRTPTALARTTSLDGRTE